jgi:hypothetical protein
VENFTGGVMTEVSATITINRKDLDLFTLHDLMREINKITPITEEQRQEIAALIKTHTHHHKRGLYERIWFYTQPWGKRGVKKRQAKKNNYKMLQGFRDRFISSKLITHSREKWGSLEKNREWCREYITEGPHCSICKQERPHWEANGIDPEELICENCKI